MSMSKAKFDSTLASIKKRGSKVTGEFASIVTTGIQLYYGETNRNIQVINDLIDCAKSLKGLRVKGLVEYLNQVIPHHNSGTKGGHLYGKMDKDKKAAMESSWQNFLSDHPVWHEYTEEKDPTPFNLVGFLTTLKKRIDKAHKDGDLDDNGLKTLKEAVSKFSFSEDAEPANDKPDLSV